MEEAETTQEEAEESKASQEETKETQEPNSGQEENPEKNQEPEQAETEKSEKSIDPKSLQAQKEHYRKKYEDALGKLDKYEKSSKSSDKAELPQTTSPMDTVKLAKALEGHSEDEIDFIVRNSSGNSPQDIVEASKDEWVKTAIEAKRKKAEEENKTPEPSSPSSAVKDKTSEDIEKMSDADYNKWLNENVGKGKRSSV